MSDPRRPATSERERILRLGPEELPVPASHTLADVWGCLMELGYPQGPVTLLYLADGTARIHFATGGAVLDAGAHVPVRAAGQALLETAQHVLAALAPTEDLAPPPPGAVRLFALTRSGPRAAQATEDDLARGDGPLSVLYHAAQALLTQVRLTNPHRRSGIARET